MSEMFLQATGIGVATVLLVDGENIPQSLAGQIIAKALPTGRPIVQRVYGDVVRLPNWREVAGFEMIHTGHAKNGADMRMVIDALDLVHRGGVGRVVIASSDRDFTHLAHYLRAKGIEVIGMGEAKTHESFRKACSRFVELGGSATSQKPATQSSNGHADARVVDLVKAAGIEGLSVGRLGAEMRQQEVDVKALGQKNWGKYLAAYPDQFRLESPPSPNYRVWEK